MGRSWYRKLNFIVRTLLVIAIPLFCIWAIWSIVSAGTLFSPHPVLLIVFLTLGGLLFVYDGVRSLIEARLHQQSIHWYKEPNLLFGIGIFFEVPFILWIFVISKTYPVAPGINAILIHIFSAYTLLFFLSAAYVYLKRRKS